jgi:hypothetical protein
VEERLVDSGVLPEYQLEELEQWKLGNKLRGIVGTEGWELVVDMLKQYETKAVEELLRLAPGDPNVLTVHAAASALVQCNRLFLEDVAAAIESSNRVPDVLKNALNVT